MGKDSKGQKRAHQNYDQQFMSVRTPEGFVHKWCQPPKLPQLGMASSSGRMRRTSLTGGEGKSVLRKEGMCTCLICS